MKTNLLSIHLNKEKLFIVLTLVIVGFFFSTFMKIGLGSGLQSKNPISGSGINYKMAHAEDGYSGFSVSDREIDYQYEALKKKQTEQQKVIAGQIQVPPVTKKTDAAKKTASKIAAQKVAQAKNEQLKKEILQKALAEHVKQEYEKQKAYEYAMASYAAESARTKLDSTKDSVNNDQESKKNRKSFSEWRSIIFANPTQETMTKFIEAFRKGEVSLEDYQSMAQDLLDQNSDKLKGLGLMALRANPSLNSLSQMVHVEDSLSAQLKAYVQQGYNAYLQGQNVTVLNQALKTTDKILIKRTLIILQAGLAKINSGDMMALTQGGRNRGQGSDVNSTLTLGNFKILKGALLVLAANSDPQIASLAQQVSGQIQSTSNIAGL